MSCAGKAALAIALAVSALFPPIVKASYLQDGVTYVPNKIIIAIEPQFASISPVTQEGEIVSGLGDIDALNRQFNAVKMYRLFPGADKKTEPDLAGYYALIFRDSITLESVLGTYARAASIEHVEPVGIHRVYYSPNDPSLSSQWAITKIDARGAWDHSRGDSTVKLGIADTGVDWDHPDLAANIWYNFADPVDGIDNDANGYIDDYMGWDWVDNETGPPGEDTDTPDNNPMDFNGHGTHVSGIASAVTNNGVGVAGLGYRCSIMCLRIGWQALDGNGYVEMSFAASALDYAWRKGAKAVNCSWGSSNSGGIATAVATAASHGVVVVSAAGNDNSTTAPYLCTRSDVVAVAAIDMADHKADFSNYGSWVDISAPGVNIYSTYFNDTYTYMDGTSMAAPFVVGLVGLIRSAAPTWTRVQVVQRITDTADTIDYLNPDYDGMLGSGRINAASALDGLGYNLAMPIPISPVGSPWINTPHAVFSWSDTTDGTNYHVQVDQNVNFTSPDISDSTITDTTFTSSDSLIDGTWYWHVRGGIGDFWTAYCNTQLFRIDSRRPNTTTLLTPAQGSWTNNRRPYFSWQAVTDVGGSGLSKYFIQADNDSLFTPPLLLNDSAIVTHYTPTYDLTGDGRIYWRVRARDNAGNYALYATRYYNLDTTPPSAPISFNASPDGWSNNANFALNWTNPSEPSGIATAYYKINTAPSSNFDTTGHFSGIPPATFVTHTNGVTRIYLWLADSVGNTSFTNRAQDSVRFDDIPPSGCLASSPDSSRGAFTVSWTAGSDGGSGIAGLYDVRYKDGIGGTWVDWLVGVSALSNIFAPVVHNHTYFFEARCRDLAGNVEPFTGIVETETVVDTTLAGPSFLPGDANGSGSVTGLDVVYLVSYLKGGPPPNPLLSGDANGSCSVTGLDVVYLVAYLKGGPAPFAGDCR